MNEFWAAIAGAAVGGLIALGIQLLALNAAAKDRREQAMDRRKALGHALLFKSIQIYSHLRSFNGNLKDALARAEKVGQKNISWQIVLPFANLPQRVHFSTDEMAMLLALKDDHLFNDMVSLDEIHNSTIDIFSVYSERRSALTAMLPAEMKGAVGSTELSAKDIAFLAPRMVELDGLLDAMVPRCEEDEKQSWDVLVRLQKTLSEKVGITYMLQPKADNELRDRAAA